MALPHQRRSSAGRDDSAAWLLLAAVGLALALASACALLLRRYRLQRRRSVGVVFVAVFGSLLLLAASTGLRVGAALPELSRGTCVLLAGGLAHTALICLRLSATSHFGGSVWDLHFGPKWSRKEGSKDSVAFELEFNSFGHAGQGCLAVLLFPATEPLLRFDWLVAVARWFSLAVIAYPAYNTVKRLHKHGAHFAVSSFFNNGLEWSMGFLLGAAVGLQLSARAGPTAPRHGLDASVALELARTTAGVVLWIVTLVAAFQLWRTWDACALPPPAKCHRCFQRAGSAAVVSADAGAKRALDATAAGFRPLRQDEDI